MSATSWWAMSTAQKMEAVLPLPKDGQALGTIAFRIGAPSRSAIAGLVHRMRQAGVIPASTKQAQLATSQSQRKRELKVKNDATGIARSPNPKPTKLLRKTTDGVVPVPMRGPNNPHRNDFKGRAEQRAAAPGIHLKREFAFDPIPNTTPVAFGSAGCKWPVDGIDGKGMVACGAPRDRSERDTEPYCISHVRLAYAAPNSHQRAVVKAAERISA